ncbi:unnamed protein product, partial [Coregonus sp. 'balchen']
STYFADLIAIVSQRYQLCPAARHLALYLLELFMDCYYIMVQHLHMVTLSCLLLARQREDRVPKLETLNCLGCMSSINLVLTKQGLLHMDCTLHRAVNEADLHDGWPMACQEKTVLYMTKYADYFLEVSLQGKFKLSVVITCISNQSCVSEVHPLTGGSCLCGSLPHPPAHIPFQATSALVAHCIHLGSPFPLCGETGHTITTMPTQYLHQANIQYPQQVLQPGLPVPLCRATPRPSQLLWIARPTFQAEPTRSISTTPVLFPALMGGWISNMEL